MKSMRATICLMAVLACAASPLDQRHIVQNPDWLKRPSAESMAFVYPAEALRRGGPKGHAVIHCSVTIYGSLRDCTVASETPPGLGFGAAAIALSPQFQLRPITVDGKPFDGGTVNIPIQWSRLTADEKPDNGPGGPVRPRGLEVALSQVPWSAAPTLNDVSAAYPQKARAARLGGLVTLNCLFGDRGSLKDCEVIEENPKGYDFGRAAKSLKSRFVGPASLPDGTSTYNNTTLITFAFTPGMIDQTAPVMGRPKWTHLPQAVDMAAAFPKAASAAHIDTGHIVMGCEVAADGRLANCAVQSETPAGLGFGAAALALSGDFQVSVWTDEGLPVVGGHVNIPIRYQLAKAPQKPPTKP